MPETGSSRSITCTTLLHGDEDIGREIGLGKASRDIGNKRSLHLVFVSVAENSVRGCKVDGDQQPGRSKADGGALTLFCDLHRWKVCLMPSMMGKKAVNWVSRT